MLGLWLDASSTVFASPSKGEATQAGELALTLQGTKWKAPSPCLREGRFRATRGDLTTSVRVSNHNALRLPDSSLIGIYKGIRHSTWQPHDGDEDSYHSLKGWSVSP